MTSTAISDFEGVLLEPGDPGYDESATTHYAKGSPKLIARPVTAEAVAAAVRFAVDQGLEVSVRAGGHGTSGVSTNDGGLVIDLRALDSVQLVGRSIGRVRIGGGATWGAVAAELEKYGLALTSGDTVSVGVGGLTLGGGIGWMVRTWGLALDSLVEAEIVLADGTIVTANGSQHPELFWALRGGGGNFGVVTSFVFDARPLEGIVHGSIEFDPQLLPEVLRGWRDTMRSAPRELNATFLSTSDFGPEMPAAVKLEVCWVGTDVAAAESAVAPLLALPGVKHHTFAASAYREILVENPGPPPGSRMVDLNGFTRELTDTQVDALVQLHRSIGGVFMIRSLGAAVGDVAADATAFAWRDSEALAVATAFLPPGTEEGAEPGIRSTWAAIGGIHGAYGNFMAQREVDGVGYPAATFARLQAVKREVDPGGVLRGNQVIVASA